MQYKWLDPDICIKKIPFQVSEKHISYTNLTFHFFIPYL